MRGAFHFCSCNGCLNSCLVVELEANIIFGKQLHQFMPIIKAQELQEGQAFVK